MTIKIVHLYYDLMNLYGENGNIRALKNHFERQNVQCEIHFLTLEDKIDFDKYDIFYIGAGTENSFLLVLNDLMKRKKDLSESIENGKYFFATGNALELFGKYMIDFNKNKLACLGLFPYYTQIIDQKDICENSDFRIVGSVSGTCTFLDKKIIGFQNRSGTIFDIDSPFLSIKYGVGAKPKDKFEGYTYKNFVGTYLLGPLFIRNPYLTDYFVKKIIKEKNKDYKFKVFSNSSEIKAYLEYLNNFKEM